MRVLITGAAGFIGRNLVKRLAVSHEVFALIRPGSTSPQGFNNSVTTVGFDLSGSFPGRDLPGQIDAIVHLAQSNSRFPDEADQILNVNTMATHHLLVYGTRAGAKQFILASTGDVYASSTELSTEADRVGPESFYSLTKFGSEVLVNTYSSRMTATIFRLFQPYGPGQAGRLIPRLAQRIREREPIVVHSSDRPVLTPIFIDDVVTAFERSLTLRTAALLNLAGRDAVTLRELATEIGAVLDVEPIFEESGKQHRNLAGDSRLMRKVLGEWPMVDLHEGLKRTLRTEEDRR